MKNNYMTIQEYIKKEVDNREQTTHTTSELLTIFLTEKYGK